MLVIFNLKKVEKIKNTFLHSIGAAQFELRNVISLCTKRHTPMAEKMVTCITLNRQEMKLQKTFDSSSAYLDLVHGSCNSDCMR